ncbi:MAG: universal stress protein [Coriobacteriia bacterium]|nr:universal stress protein [Coriobacteriia bacterium]
MISRAVIATDLGASSWPVVRCAASLTALGLSECVLIYVLDPDQVPRADDDATFADQAEALSAVGLRVSVETAVGYAPHAITDVAERHGADLIVMGSQGKGLFHVGFSGSVSSDVVRLSPIPVLLVPQGGTDSENRDTPNAASGQCRELLNSALLPTDFSPAADNALDLTCRVGARMIGRLTVLHVIESSFEALRDGAERTAHERLDAIARRAIEAGIRDVRPVLALGDPDHTVAEYAASGDYSIVILGPRCLDTIDQEFGSVTSAALRTARSPMLLAPPGCGR